MEGQESKVPAPSIWSFDSGYASVHIDEDGDLRLDDFREANRHDHTQPSIEPTTTTKLHVFTSQGSTDNAFLLPEIASSQGVCLQCEFWKITNPGEDVRCEECRIPKIVEPASLLVNGWKGKSTDAYTTATTYLGSQHKSKEAHGVSQFSTTTRCSACELALLISPSYPTCASCCPNPGLLSPPSPSLSPSSPKVRRSRAGRNSKLPLTALNRLQAWLDANTDNPYPSAKVKKELAQECGITEKQVGTWFVNARARQLNPLERWASSGSEDEGAREEDIERAAGVGVGMVGVGLGLGLGDSGFTYLVDGRPSPSLHRRTGSVSGSSVFSGGAGACGRATTVPNRRGKKKNYRRSNAPPQIDELSPISPVQEQTSPTFNRAPVNRQPDQETWQCTFCLRPLVPKSWRRHEETQHRPRSQWTCMLYGPRLSFPPRSNTTLTTTPNAASNTSPTSNSNSTSYCAFCLAPSPSESHFLTHHRIPDCAKRSPKERTFFRPDHLRQHVRNFHGARLLDIAQVRWKTGARDEHGEGEGDAEGGKGWICGFCGERLRSWDRRETHVAGHFKEGWTMADWRTDWTDQDQKQDKESGKRRRKAEAQAQAQKQKEEEKAGHHHHHHSSLSRLGQTFSFGRKLKTSHAQAFDMPPTTTGSLTMHPAFSNTSPDVPMLDTDINMDPILSVSGYSGDDLVDWNQIQLAISDQQQPYPQPPTSMPPHDGVFNPSQQTEFNDALDNVLDHGLEFGNVVDVHEPWDQE